MAIVDELVAEAVQVLRACGCTVEPWSSNYPLWLVDGETFTDGGVMVLVRAMTTGVHVTLSHQSLRFRNPAGAPNTVRLISQEVQWSVNSYTPETGRPSCYAETSLMRMHDSIKRSSSVRIRTSATTFSTIWRMITSSKP
ncbi:hypothetical protein MKK84_04575, partial [Methylobacterium sp. E-065]|uniref:hypothetical protein n=1 Tax=Methylobacterium sp. E-065 TaxID=2836583 RepID=UPI001FBA675A